MEQSYAVFENLSQASGVGITVLDSSGKIWFESSMCASAADFLETLHFVSDSGEADRISLLYGCYQARRFGGRYIFFTPSGLTYCTSPLFNRGDIMLGAAAGPFLMTDHNEYIDIDILDRHRVDPLHAEILREGIRAVPLKTPAQARAVSELLFVCSAHFNGVPELEHAPQAEVFALCYSVEKEDELISAITRGDIHTANILLNDILGQILFYTGSDLEILRSRVIELTVLLSRAALKGGANIDAIFGLNYSYLREIDALASTDDIVLWLHNVTRRFTQHVFDFSGAKHMDVIYRAIAYIKSHYADRIILQDVSDHVSFSLTYFCKIFKDETGQTPGAYITSVRVEESKKLLRDMRVNIVDIPELVGFESQSYFTRVFKKAAGYTPGRFRQRFLQGADASGD